MTNIVVISVTASVFVCVMVLVVLMMTLTAVVPVSCSVLATVIVEAGAGAVTVEVCAPAHKCVLAWLAARWPSTLRDLAIRTICAAVRLSLTSRFLGASEYAVVKTVLVLVNVMVLV